MAVAAVNRLLPALLFGAALALIATSAEAGDKTYIAIGDSITQGSSHPASCGICPVVFDCTGGCSTTSQTNREKCGYVRRLDAWLGAGHYVRNEGVGAEDTSEALSRFASEMNSNCGTPGDCVAVILMHGTNDMDKASISPESARDNMRSMITEAKSRNIDVLLMSIVRRVYMHTHTKWQAYRDLILALAGEQDLQSVDPHTPLCNNNWKCYNDNYWINGDTDVPPDGIDDLDEGPTDCTDPGEGDNDLGHLDPDGYDVLADKIKDAFPANTPSAPTPTTPTGTITNTKPDFVWSGVSTSRWFELEVDGTKSWWEDAVHCGSTCTVNPGVTLAEGAHTWRVRGRNLRGMGSWSATKSFTVSTIQPPIAPTPVAPTGELWESAPTYEWLPVSGATEYDLEVRDSGGNLDASAAALAAGTVCTASLCSHVEGTVLTGTDDYTLKVKARNSGGDSPLSEPGLGFTIRDCDASVKDLQDFASTPVTTVETVEHCGLVTAATLGAYTIDPSGDVTIFTRDGFAASNGFSVNSGTLIVISP